MRKNKITICMIAGMLFGSSCSNQEAPKADVANVKLVAVKNSEAIFGQDFPGRVKAAEEVNMAFKISGTLIHVYVEDGSIIRKGQPIAEVDPRDYQLQFNATEAEYLKVKSEAERVMALYEDSVSTADAYDKARYGLQQITAKYENARNQLNDTKIYSPFDGFVKKRIYDPPMVIAAGMPVVTIVSEGKQEIEINIPAETYMRRNEIASFNASFDFIPNQRIPLRLISISPTANANQLYTVRLAIPQNISPQPSPGMNTMVTLNYRDNDVSKTEIPSSSLFQKDGQSCVWIYNGKAESIERRIVSVERLDTNGKAIITQGLSSGDLIVAAGVNKLTDKQKVKPVDTKSETNVGGIL